MRRTADGSHDLRPRCPYFNVVGASWAAILSAPFFCPVPLGSKRPHNIEVRGSGGGGSACSVRLPNLDAGVVPSDLFFVRASQSLLHIVSVF